VKSRLLGVVLFLPVPIVLALFTRMPFGVRLSLAVGVAVMLTHRLYARPFARRHADERCLWCGRTCVGRASVRIAEPLGETDWLACSEAHGDRLARTLAWAGRHRMLLRAAIGGGLVLFLAGVLLGWRADDGVAFFRFAVAVAVLPLGWRGLYGALPDVEPIAVPFPVHIQALIGTAPVLWLFRIVGLVWLGLAIAHAGGRLGLWPAIS
jgi:hypothetical protein